MRLLFTHEALVNARTQVILVNSVEERERYASYVTIFQNGDIIRFVDHEGKTQVGWISRIAEDKGDFWIIPRNKAENFQPVSSTACQKLTGVVALFYTLYFGPIQMEGEAREDLYRTYR